MSAIILSSCGEQRNCPTCVTNGSHPSVSTPKVGVVKEVRLTQEGESAQDFRIIFTDENGNTHDYRSEVFVMPGDTITWY